MPQTKKNKFKTLIWIACSILAILLLLAAAGWYVNIKSKPFLTQQIKENVYKSTDSLYTISFTNLTTNILTGNATLENVQIRADSNRYRQLVALKRAPNNLYNLRLKKMVVRHFHPITFYRFKKLRIDEIVFDKPQVVMINKQFSFNDDRPPRPLKSPYTLIKNTLAEFSIGNLKFSNASFKYIDENAVKPETFDVDQINILLVDFLIDSTSAEDPTRFYLLKDVKVNIHDYSYLTADKMYKIKLKELNFGAATGKLKIDRFSLEPLYSEMEFGKVAGYAKDRYDIEFSNVLLDKIDLPLFIKKRTIWAKTMAIQNGHVEVFNNNSLAHNNNNKRVGKFPQQLLQKLEVPVLIQQINLKDIDIGYAEYDRNSNQKGVISFKSTSGTFKNVTNLATIKAINPSMQVALTTYLMGQGKLFVHFNFDLNSDKGAFTYGGALKDVNARVLNQITKPLGLVRINRGNVDELSFKFKADDAGADGIVNFKYYDLSLALMENDPAKDHLVKRGLISFLANALLINSENPSADGKFTSAPVHYVRQEGSSFFNMLWRSLFVGVKHSIGITEEKEKEVKIHIAKFKEMRASHEARKERRIERRRQRENR
ncbi:hypothetical protein ABIB40_000521 [Pedobacter sp. UYP30]|uniref:hypothetical protein n=1 Tax=Pedobacter sp. UYP30 TaxID=1756400 RepID=UPI0033964B10